MKNENSALKPVFWFAVCNIIQKSVMIITVPIFTRMMTPDEYGLTAVYQSWYNVLSIIVTLSLSLGVFNNGMLHYKDDRDRYISSMQGLSSVSAICCLLVFLIFRKPLTALIGLPEYVILMMFISFIFSPSFEYWSARNRYEYRYKGLLLATLIYSFINVIVPIAGILVAKGNLGEAKIVATLVGMIVFTAAFYVNNLWKGKRFYVKEYWKYAFWFNLPLLPNYLSNVILHQSDRIMISRYCGEAAAGIYSVACYLQTGLTVINSAINSAFVPWLYEKLERKNYGVIQKRAEQILAILGLLTFCIISCGPELIKLLAPAKYYEAMWSVAPVVLGTFFTIMYTLCANVEIYYEKRVFMSCATMIAAGANVVLNFIFIPKLGYIACAYTTLFCYFVYGVAHYYFMCRIQTEDGLVKEIGIYDIRRIAIIYIVTLALSALQMLLYRTLIWRIASKVTILGLIAFARRKYNDK